MLKFEDFLTNVSVEDVVAALKGEYKIPFIEKGTFRAQIPLIINPIDSEPCHILIPAVVNLKTNEATAIYTGTQVQIRDNHFYIENDRTEHIFLYIATLLLELLNNPEECARSYYSAFVNNVYQHPLDYIECFLGDTVPGIDYLFLTEIKDKVAGVPTFDVTNGYRCDPVHTTPHDLEELYKFQYDACPMPRGVLIPNSFPLYTKLISEQTCTKMGVPAPYTDEANTTANKLCKDHFDEICLNFFFEYLSDYTSLMLDLFDLLAIEIFNGRGTTIMTRAIKRAADALETTVPDFTSKKITLPSGKVLKARDTNVTGTQDYFHQLCLSEGCEDLYNQLYPATPLFEEVPSQDFPEHSSFEAFHDSINEKHSEFQRSMRVHHIKQVAAEEGLTLTDKEIEDVLAMLPTAELDEEALNRAIRTALQPLIEKARAFFTEE